MGTPDFAVPSLDILIKSDCSVPCVVTVPDKPAGRGQVIKYSPIKEFALKNNLKIQQPLNLKDQEFINELKSFHPDLIVVVAFRMLPEVVWKIPPLGTINLHASLLPQYRGAAPINWVIINGERETGVTTFFINEIIDTGSILLNRKLSISDEETAGELHDRLMVTGADLLLETINGINEGTIQPVSQNQLVTINAELKPAPKIFRQDCRISWDQSAERVNNLIRGLSPYPAAFTNLISDDGENLVLKIYKAKPVENSENLMVNEFPGTIETDQRKYLNVACRNGHLSLLEVQLEGKRRMNIQDFLKGFRISEKWRFG
jgi:methionyl-tRNA formyltransferase